MVVQLCWLLIAYLASVASAEDTDNSPSWLSTAKPMTPLNVQERCNVQDMGCFMLIPTFKKTELKKPITHEKCLHKCYMEYTKYSGLVNNQCYCGRTLDKFVSNSTCNTDCSIELAKNCKTEGSIHIYKLDIYTESCSSDFKDGILEISRIGCSEIPDTLHNESSVWTMNKMTGQQCVMQCEMYKYTIAIPVKKFDACICSFVFGTLKTAEDVIASQFVCNRYKLKKGEIVPMYKTSSWDNQCMHRQFLTKYPADKVVWVTGFGGSGTSWLRHLIEVLTGYYTGNYGEEVGAYEEGLLGEKLSVTVGRTAVNYMMFRNYIYRGELSQNRIILIIRSPYDALMSTYASIFTGSRKASLPSGFYDEDEFYTFVMEEILNWQMLPMIVLDKKAIERETLLIYYEDLVNDTIGQVRRIADFLPQDLIGGEDRLEKRLICTAIEMQGNFKRSEKYKKKDYDPFDPFIKREIDDSVNVLDNFLKENNYQPLPDSYFRYKKRKKF